MTKMALDSTERGLPLSLVEFPGIPNRPHSGIVMGKKVGAGDNLAGLLLEALIADQRNAAKEHLDLTTKEQSVAHHFGNDSTNSLKSSPTSFLPEGKFSCRPWLFSVRTRRPFEGLASLGILASSLDWESRLPGRLDSHLSSGSWARSSCWREYWPPSQRPRSWLPSSEGRDSRRASQWMPPADASLGTSLEEDPPEVLASMLASNLHPERPVPARSLRGRWIPGRTSCLVVLQRRLHAPAPIKWGRSLCSSWNCRTSRGSRKEWPIQTVGPHPCEELSWPGSSSGKFVGGAERIKGYLTYKIRLEILPPCQAFCRCAKGSTCYAMQIADSVSPCQPGEPPMPSWLPTVEWELPTSRTDLEFPEEKLPLLHLAIPEGRMKNHPSW